MMTNNFDTLKPLFSKVFFYRKERKGFSQSAQRENNSNSNLCVLCEKPLRSLRLRFWSFETTAPQFLTINHYPMKFHPLNPPPAGEILTP